jgi:hypothetical protein
MTESEYLDRQESRLRGELTRAAVRIEAHLNRALPVERVVREHPVVSMGASAVGGIVAGLVVGRLLNVDGAGALLRSLRLAARPMVWATVRGARSFAIDALSGSDSESPAEGAPSPD